jgi:hypothetical protein
MRDIARSRVREFGPIDLRPDPPCRGIPPLAFSTHFYRVPSLGRGKDLLQKAPAVIGKFRPLLPTMNRGIIFGTKRGQGKSGAARRPLVLERADPPGDASVQ